MTVEPGSVEVADDGTAVVAFRQVPRHMDVDAGAGGWQATVDDLVGRGARRAVLDWCGIGSVVSTDCGLLLVLVQRLRQRGIPAAAVVGRTGRVRDVWRLVRLDKAVPTFDTREAAVDHLRDGAGTTGPEAR